MAALIALALVTCQAFGEGDDWYILTAAEMTEDLGVLVKDQAYQAMLTQSLNECVDQLKQVDYAQVTGAYRLDILEDQVMRLFYNAASGAELTDIAFEYAYSRLPQTLLTSYNGRRGSECLAAAAMLTYTRTFVMPQNFKPCVMLLALNGGIAGVAFEKTGEDTVTAIAQPVFCDADATANDVAIELTQAMPIATIGQKYK